MKTEQPQRLSFTRSMTTPISVFLFGTFNALEHVGVSHVSVTKYYSPSLIQISQFGVRAVKMAPETAFPQIYSFHMTPRCPVSHLEHELIDSLKSTIRESLRPCVTLVLIVSAQP
jgi:hypothetical protein